MLLEAVFSRLGNIIHITWDLLLILSHFIQKCSITRMTSFSIFHAFNSSIQIVILHASIADPYNFHENITCSIIARDFALTTRLM